MVKILHASDKEAIQQAVFAAEQHTNAEIAVVVARASDEYRAIAMSYGLVLGSVIALLLWREKIATGFPLLLFVQLFFAMLFVTLPFLRHACLRFAPVRLLHHRAAQRAAQEYLHLARHLTPSVPIVLLYVSLAERYVHIHTSRSVREKIADEQWHTVVKTLTSLVTTHGFSHAVIQALGHAGELLKQEFPAGDRVHGSPHVVER